MSRSSVSGFCRRCACTVKLAWQEPRHHVYSALTLSLMACQAVTVPIGGLMAVVWCHRLLSTRGWGCPHCRERISAGGRRILSA
jgi:hypothetical protein